MQNLAKQYGLSLKLPPHQGLKLIRKGQLLAKEFLLTCVRRTFNLAPNEEVKLLRLPRIAVEQAEDCTVSATSYNEHTGGFSVTLSFPSVMRSGQKNITVYGNLPYNISTQILAKFILLSKWPPWFDVLIFMFQKEVAERIIEKSKSKKFGRLSVLSNWRMEIKKHFDVSKNCFYPKPKVNSTVLSFKPIIDYKFKLKNPKNLENVTKVMFSTRRKMINKNFFKLFGNKQYIADELNIKLNQRPEQLSSETYYRIAKKYETLFN